MYHAKKVADGVQIPDHAASMCTIHNRALDKEHCHVYECNERGVTVAVIRDSSSLSKKVPCQCVRVLCKTYKRLIDFAAAAHRIPISRVELVIPVTLKVYRGKCIVKIQPSSLPASTGYVTENTVGSIGPCFHYIHCTCSSKCVCHQPTKLC